MFVAKSASQPAKLRYQSREKASRFRAAPMELELIYCVYKGRT